MNKNKINFRDFELMYLLTLKELKVRYKNSFFGYLWTIANPFAYAMVYYFAFKVVLRVEIENFSTYLLIGLFPWMWVSNSLGTTSSAFRTNISFIKNTVIKPDLLILAGVINEMVHFLFAIPILIIVLCYSDQTLFFSWFWQLPVLIAVQAILIFPLGLIFGTFNIMVKDIEYLIGIATTLLFFLTPIVYPIGLVPDSYKFIYHLNPFVFLIDAWHKVFLNGYIPLSNLFFLLAFSLVLFPISRIIYSQNIHKAAERL